MVSNDVILVDENDHEVGTSEKMHAHQKGLMHRAFSVFIFNSRGEMLLQRRALSKYHSPGLWSNTCCSHPFPNEDTKEAALRRLNEEMGFKTSLQKAFDFTYNISFENGLTENEFDHVFVGTYDGQVQPNGDEVMDFAFKSREEIKKELLARPESYTGWFHIAFPKVEEWARTIGNKQ